jgi:hypothetical protein
LRLRNHRIELYLNVIIPVLAQSSATISLKETKPFQAPFVFFSDPSNRAYPLVRSFKVFF